MWRVAHALDTLLAEINAAAPHRSKVSDGSIGDAAHASRASDHNPWVILGGVGIVRARDFTHDPAGGMDGAVLAMQVAALLGVHPALKTGAYVIFNRRIISADRKAEGWRPYAGSNAHEHHVHISVTTVASGFDSRASWGVLAKPRPVAPTPAKHKPTSRADAVGERRRLTELIQAGRPGRLLEKLKAARARLPKAKP